VTRLLHLIGAGRTGSALGAAFARSGHPIGAVVARSAASAAEAVRRIGSGEPTIDPCRALRAGDRTLIALPEAAIAPTVAALATTRLRLDGAIVLHVAGSLDCEVLAPLRATGASVGTLHPCAAFPDRVAPPLAGVTFDLDGDAPAIAVARELVDRIGGHALELPRGGKPLFHAAACLSANSLTALLEPAIRMAQAAGASEPQARAAMTALARSAVDAVAKRGAIQALTGPIERGEHDVIAAHVAALDRLAPELASTYRQLARLTLATARRRDGRDPARDDAIERLLAERR
jgi:predicted short-subunit dehydrogenase-like oxidoreductase (DUF2520 family)